MSKLTQELKNRKWVETTLGEVMFPVSETYNFKNIDKIHFLNTSDILEGKLLHNNFLKVDSLPGQAKKKFKKNDILYSEIRPLNKRFMLVDFDASMSVASTKLMVIRPKDIIDVKFLYILITSDSFLQEFQIIAESRSGTFPQITFSAISNIDILLPPLNEQKEIVNILSSLDGKIELLQEQNKILEETAQTIFKEWFGKYNVDKPEKLPNTWKVGNLGEICSLKSGFAFSGDDFVEKSNTPVLKIKDLKGLGSVDLTDVSFVKDDVREIDRVNYFKLDEGDVVLAMSGNTTGKIGVIPKGNNDIFLNQRVGKFFMKDLKYKSFLYFFLMTEDYEKKILNMGYGSAQPNINPSQIENIKLIFPDDSQMNKFLDILSNIFNKILENNFQIERIKNISKVVLPKLINGNIPLM